MGGGERCAPGNLHGDGYQTKDEQYCLDLHVLIEAEEVDVNAVFLIDVGC